MKKLEISLGEAVRMLEREIEFIKRHDSMPIELADLMDSRLEKVFCAFEELLSDDDDFLISISCDYPELAGRIEVVDTSGN